MGLVKWIWQVLEGAGMGGVQDRGCGDGWERRGEGRWPLGYHLLRLLEPHDGIGSALGLLVLK